MNFEDLIRVKTYGKAYIHISSMDIDTKLELLLFAIGI